jgi:hypothetical protein
MRAFLGVWLGTSTQRRPQRLQEASVPRSMRELIAFRLRLEKAAKIETGTDFPGIAASSASVKPLGGVGRGRILPVALSISVGRSTVARPGSGRCCGWFRSEMRRWNSSNRIPPSASAPRIWPGSGRSSGITVGRPQHCPVVRSAKCWRGSGSTGPQCIRAAAHVGNRSAKILPATPVSLVVACLVCPARRLTSREPASTPPLACVG